MEYFALCCASVICYNFIKGKPAPAARVINFLSFYEMWRLSELQAVIWNGDLIESVKRWHRTWYFGVSAPCIVLQVQQPAWFPIKLSELVIEHWMKHVSLKSHYYVMCHKNVRLSRHIETRGVGWVKVKHLPLLWRSALWGLSWDWIKTGLQSLKIRLRMVADDSPQYTVGFWDVYSELSDRYLRISWAMSFQSTNCTYIVCVLSYFRCGLGSGNFSVAASFISSLRFSAFLPQYTQRLRYKEIS